MGRVTTFWIYLVYVVEYIGHCMFSNAGHSVRFPTACLPIGENSRWKKDFSGKHYNESWARKEIQG